MVFQALVIHRSPCRPCGMAPVWPTGPQPHNLKVAEQSQPPTPTTPTRERPNRAQGVKSESKEAAGDAVPIHSGIGGPVGMSACKVGSRGRPWDGRAHCSQLHVGHSMACGTCRVWVVSFISCLGQRAVRGHFCYCVSAVVVSFILLLSSRSRVVLMFCCVIMSGED